MTRPPPRSHATPARWKKRFAGVAFSLHSSMLSATSRANNARNRCPRSTTSATPSKKPTPSHSRSRRLREQHHQSIDVDLYVDDDGTADAARRNPKRVLEDVHGAVAEPRSAATTRQLSDGRAAGAVLEPRASAADQPATVGVDREPVLGGKREHVEPRRPHV